MRRIALCFCVIFLSGCSFALTKAGRSFTYKNDTMEFVCSQTPAKVEGSIDPSVTGAFARIFKSKGNGEKASSPAAHMSAFVKVCSDFLE